MNEETARALLRGLLAEQNIPMPVETGEKSKDTLALLEKLTQPNACGSICAPVATALAQALEAATASRTP